MMQKPILSINHSPIKSHKKVLNQQERAEINPKAIKMASSSLLRCRYLMISKLKEKKVATFSLMKKSNKVSILEKMTNFKFREKLSLLKTREMPTRSINLRITNWPKNTHKIFLKNTKASIIPLTINLKRKINSPRKFTNPMWMKANKNKTILILILRTKVMRMMSFSIINTKEDQFSPSYANVSSHNSKCYFQKRKL